MLFYHVHGSCKRYGGQLASWAASSVSIPVGMGFRRFGARIVEKCAGPGKGPSARVSVLQ